ncbi:MAG: OmpA family protein [Balneolaceae bacterium]|jgi:outer membrane protein OmpA-like peptidoglycan-associated protein
MKYPIFNKLATFVIILFIGIACKETNSLVRDARMGYQEAISDSAVANGAPVALEEAHDELKMIQNLRKNGAGKALINHHAYIAKQKVATAYQVAELNATQDKVERARKERQLVMNEVQKAEALLAQRRTEEARREAEEAQRRSQELAQRISELEAEQTERGIVLTLNNVLFDFGKATLKPVSNESISKLARFLIEYPERKVMIEGFTDSIGPSEANKTLSLLRAEAVKTALISHGIEENRILTRGYGEDFAVADNNTESGRQLNRRVEIVISDARGIVTERRQR